MNLCIPVTADQGLASGVGAHFGSAPLFLIVDTESRATRAIPNRDRHHGHGMCQPLLSLAGEAVDAVVVGGIGRGALGGFQAAGIRVYLSDSPTVEAVVTAFQAGSLREATPAEACGHHGQGPHDRGAGGRRGTGLQAGPATAMDPCDPASAMPQLRRIGVIRTPFQEAVGTPIQPVYGEGVEGEVLLEESLERALEDLDGFERLWLIYWMDRAGPFAPTVVPYRDTREHGLFATRSPCRPNPIGMSVVRLLSRDGSRLRVADLDILDGTPLLDLKPYVPSFDAWCGSRAGWLDGSAEDRRNADDRFHR